MNIKDSINAEMWTKQQYVGDDERCDHNDSIGRIQEAVGEYTKGLEKRIRELKEALETLMDDYQYNVCFDHHYAAARKVLKGRRNETRYGF